MPGKRWLAVLVACALVAVLGTAVASPVFASKAGPAVAGGQLQACEDGGSPFPLNLTGNQSFWVSYNTTTGAVTGLYSEPYGGTLGSSPWDANLNITSNLSLVREIYCDSYAGDLSYWHVNLTTQQLERTAPT